MHFESILAMHSNDHFQYTAKIYLKYIFNKVQINNLDLYKIK